MLRLPANADAVPALRYAAFADAAVDPALGARVRGRTVFVGSPSMMDARVMTPLGQIGGTQWQALAFESLAQRLVDGACEHAADARLARSGPGAFAARRGAAAAAPAPGTARLRRCRGRR